MFLFLMIQRASNVSKQKIKKKLNFHKTKQNQIALQSLNDKSIYYIFHRNKQNEFPSKKSINHIIFTVCIPSLHFTIIIYYYNLEPLNMKIWNPIY